MTSDRSFRDRLDELPPAFDLGADPGHVIRRGRRIRAVRQSLVAGAAAVAVVGVATSAVMLTGHRSTTTFGAAAGGGMPAGSTALPTSSSPAGIESPAAGAVATTAASSSPSPSATEASCTPAAQPAVDAPPPGDGANATPWGALIGVTQSTSGTRLVLYGFHIADPANLPCTHVGFMLGTTTGSAGAVHSIYATNEFAGSDLAPGFHGTALTTPQGGSDWYVIGYYVGPAASISLPAKQFGTDFQAQVAPWSVNADVKVWWVHGTGSTPTFGAPSAADAQGKPLPAGIHVGTPAVG
jgi:hypothetical protein